jgi:excisionase family DNA binding protein
MIALPLLTVQEASKRLSVSQSQIYRLIATGKLTAIRIGKSIRIRNEDLDNFTCQNQTAVKRGVKMQRPVTLKHLGANRNK